MQVLTGRYRMIQIVAQVANKTSCIATASPIIALLSYKFDAQATAVLGIALIAFGEEIGKLPRPAADASRDPQQQSINMMYNLVSYNIT